MAWGTILLKRTPTGALQQISGHYYGPECFFLESQEFDLPFRSDVYMFQARSQAEARTPGLQHHMGIDARLPDFVACK